MNHAKMLPNTFRCFPPLLTVTGRFLNRSFQNEIQEAFIGAINGIMIDMIKVTVVLFQHGDIQFF